MATGTMEARIEYGGTITLEAHCPVCLRDEEIKVPGDLWRGFLVEVYAGPDRATYAIQKAAEIALAERFKVKEELTREIERMTKALERVRGMIDSVREDLG